MIFLYFRLKFSYLNNIAKYEALVIGLISTLQMSIQKLQVWGDSKLIIH